VFSVCQAEQQFELLTRELELTDADHAARKKICRQLEALLQPTFNSLSFKGFHYVHYWRFDYAASELVAFLFYDDVGTNMCIFCAVLRILLAVSAVVSYCNDLTAY